MSTRRSLEIIAHRGGAGLGPENTLGAIRQAVELGVDWIEVDVRQTKDKAIVCLHDNKVNRTTNGRGKLRKLTLEEVRELDAGGWFSNDFVGEVVPTLEEVMLLVQGKCRLLVEVKRDQKDKSGFAEGIIALIKKYDAFDWVVVQSFFPNMLRQIYLQDSTVRLNQLLVYKHPYIPVQYDGVIRAGNVFRSGYLEAINLDHRFVSKKLVRKIHSKHKRIFCWTVNEPDRMKELIRMGVDGIITDYPNRLKALLAERIAKVRKAPIA